jgi:O-antigen ligase
VIQISILNLFNQDATISQSDLTGKLKVQYTPHLLLRALAGVSSLMGNMTFLINDGSIRKALHIFILVFLAGSVFSIAVAQTALALSALFWILIIARHKGLDFTRTPLDYFFLAFIFIGLISLLVHLESEAAVNYIKRVLLIIIVYLLASCVRERKLLRAALVTVTGTTTVLAFIGIWIYLSGEGGLSGRLELFNHYMTSGGILMMVSLITFGFTLVAAPLKIRILSAMAVAVIILPLIFTFTRSAWLGLIMGMTFMCVLGNRKILGGILLLILLFFLFSPPSFKNRAISSFDPSHPHNVERVYMWKAGADIIGDYPLVGAGDKDFIELYAKYKRPEAKEIHGHFHNNFIMFGVIWGVPGLLIFMFLFLRILITEIRVFMSVSEDKWLLKGTALGALGAFAGFHVAGLFEWNFGDAEVVALLWITVGLALAAGRLSGYPLSGDRLETG